MPDPWDDIDRDKALVETALDEIRVQALSRLVSLARRAENWRLRDSPSEQAIEVAVKRADKAEAALADLRRKVEGAETFGTWCLNHGGFVGQHPNTEKRDRPCKPGVELIARPDLDGEEGK